MKRFSALLLLILCSTMVLEPVVVYGQQAISCTTISTTNYSGCCSGNAELGNFYACQAYLAKQACNTVNGVNYSKCCSTTTGAYSQNKQKCDAQSKFNTAQGRYNPQVNFFGSNGITVAGVGSTILSCAGTDELLSDGISAAKKAIGSTIGNLGKKLFGAATGVGKLFAKLIPGGGIASDLLGGILGGGSKEVKEPALRNKENCLDKIAYLLAQQAMAQVTQKTLNWVNSGFGGNATYVRDIGSYMQSLQKDEISGFLGNVQNTNPIFGTLLRSVVTEQVTGKADGFLNKISGKASYPFEYKGKYCADDYARLAQVEYEACIKSGGQANTSIIQEACRSRIIGKYDALSTQNCVNEDGKKYNEFMKNFATGGWNTFLDSRYNPVSAIFNATDQLGSSIATTQQNQKNELARNSGFLDLKRCLEYENEGRTGTGANGQGLSQEPKCLRYETTTPGSIIASQVSNITSSPVRQIELVDELNEALGKLLDSMLNSLFSKGLSSLQGGLGAGEFTGGTGPGDNVVFGTDGEILKSGDEKFFDYQSTNNGIGGLLNGFDISRPQNLRAVIKVQKDYINYSTDAVIALNRIVPTTGKLDYCLPGPNPTWEEELTTNFRTLSNNFFASSISTRQRFIPDSVSSLGDISSAQISSVELIDKITGAPVTIGDRIYDVSGGDGNDLRTFLVESFSNLTERFELLYNPERIANAFAELAPASEQTYTRAQILNGYNETVNLVGYAQNTAELNTEYTENIGTTEAAVAELEAINAEVIAIVKKAKARYIAEQQAAGTPVNVQCLDRAYVIDESPIVGAQRQEPDIPSPIIKQSGDALDYFYTQL